MNTFDELSHLHRPAVVVLVEMDEDTEEMKSRIRTIEAKFRIAVCRLRSPNEVKTEPGIDAIISRHIKRDSLRNIVDQLLKSGDVLQPTTLHIPYLSSARNIDLRIPNIGEDEALEILMAEDNQIVIYLNHPYVDF